MALVQAREDVLVVRAQAAGLELRVLHVHDPVLRVHLHEARGVPDLCAEVAADLELLVGDVDVLPRRGQHDQAEPQRIGAVLAR